ncbi:MAG: hypothetical protein EBV03_07365 [Proteobacteria bacterium]|nr:hypothetical protein [Pseudomonadota bacterium]
MGAAALKKNTLAATGYTQKSEKPSLAVVSQQQASPQVQKNTTTSSPDFEAFMNQYGMWSDFA